MGLEKAIAHGKRTPEAIHRRKKIFSLVQESRELPMVRKKQTIQIPGQASGKYERSRGGRRGNAMKDLKTLNTVEEVESLRCFECARDGHWGWCDAPWIKCPYKDRIKEILGLSESRFSSLEEQMPGIFGKEKK